VDDAHLEAFLAVARYATIKEASRHLHLAPSTVTNRLQSLERRLGVVLVDRTRGRSRTTLTAEGEEFLLLAERWEDMAREMATLTTRADAALAIGAPDTVNHFLLLAVYGELARTHAELALHVDTANSAELYGKLERREVDVAFVLYDRYLADVVIEPFIREEMLVATRAELAPEGSEIPLAALQPDGEIHIPWGAAYERWRAQALGRSTGRIFVDTAHTVLAFLDDHRKWALLPASMTRGMQGEGPFRTYRLAEAPPDRLVFIARRTHVSRAAHNGYTLFAEAVERLLPADERLARSGSPRADAHAQ
jgi:DNA-binding transcriptional LysR family regulator